MNNSAGHHLLAALRGGLVVSCQANPGEPFRDSESMGKFASSARMGGAVGVRTEGLSDIALVHELIPLPQIGLWKTDDIEDVFITPTVEHALAVAQAGAEIVAIDGTRRLRPDGKTLRETIDAIREHTGVLVMADTATFDDAEFAISAGADMVSTALSGYTRDSVDRGDGPDLDLVRAITERFDTPVFAEGRFRTPAQAAKAIALGAHAVVVGAAITDPIAISAWFVDAMKEAAP